MVVYVPRKGTKRWTKKPEKTRYLEQFNGTMRQRVSRPVRKTLSFSKKFANHIEAI